MRVLKKTGIISLLIVLVLMTCSVPISATEVSLVIYDQIDMTDRANGKFWHVKDILSNSDPDWNTWKVSDWATLDIAQNKTAASYPIEFISGKNISEATGSVVCAGSDTERAVIKSKNNVPYLLPVKRDGYDTPEAIVLATNSGANASTNKVDLNGKQYTMLNLLIASGLNTDCAALTVTINYKDGTSEIPLNAISVPLERCIPGEGKYGKNYTENYQFYVGGIQRTGARWGNPTYGFQYSNTYNLGEHDLALYEYRIPVNEDKQLSDISFKASITAGGKYPNVVIAGLTGERDWSNAISAADEAILKATEDTTDVEKVLSAVNLVNEVKNVGLENYLQNFAEFNSLFADKSFLVKLIEGIYQDSGTFDWVNAEEQLKQTKGLIEAVGYDSFTIDAKDKLNTIFNRMITSLLSGSNSNETDRERFLLLKNSGIEQLTSILYKKVLWVEEYSADINSEWVFFKLIFSQSIDADSLIEDYLVLKNGNEEIVPELVKYDILDDNIVIVKTVNSLVEDAKYTLEIKKGFNGVDGGKCAYIEKFEETPTQPIGLSKEGVLTDDQTVSGAFEIKNNKNNIQPYVLLVAFYDSGWKMLGVQSFIGTVLPGEVHNQPVNCTLSDETSEIICYLMDSYESGNLLAPVCRLQ